jgi:hypothetical protein
MFTGHSGNSSVSFLLHSPIDPVHQSGLPPGEGDTLIATIIYRPDREEIIVEREYGKKT